MAKRMFQGSIVALVTPFRDGKVDEAALKVLVEFQIAGGMDGIVPCGTTGESPTLDHDEHKRVIDIVIQTVNKRVPVIAGTGLQQHGRGREPHEARQARRGRRGPDRAPVL